MAIKPAGSFSQQTGIGSGTDAADRTNKLRPDVGVSVVLALTSGSPSTGAKLEVTNSSYADIDAGTATWVTPSGLGNVLDTSMWGSTVPGGCQFTAIRAVATDGTWSLTTRQDS